MQTLGTSMLKGEIKESKPSQESPRRTRESINPGSLREDCAEAMVKYPSLLQSR